MNKKENATEKIDFQIERLILKNGNLINNVRISDLKNYDLTPAQSETILYYAAHDRASIKDLALHLDITHQAARKLVDKLKAKGVIEAVTSKEDRRFTNIYLTDAGQGLCAKLKGKGFSVGSRILNGFSATEKQTLLSYLKRVAKNLGQTE